MDQKKTAECAQNAVEGLIPIKKFIQGVTKALVDNTVTMTEAFMKANTQVGMLDDLVQALKEYETFRIFLKLCVATVAERITAEYLANT